MKQNVLRILTALLLAGNLRAADPAPEPTPVNQVFQYMSSGSYTAWISHQERKATCYLWIPETCKRVRGLLVLGANIPEHRVVGHDVLRRMCTSNALGIIWTTPSFLHPVNWSKPFPPQEDMKHERETMVVFFQKQLDALATISGYDEIATVPWLPIGESTHMFLVDALLESRPQRCIAGIYLKNTRMPPTNRQTPVLGIFGTAQEWDQEKIDIRSRWNNISGFYEGQIAERKKNPGWPRSLVIDGHSGHFDCSDRLVSFMAKYIEQAIKARCSTDGSPSLKPVDIASGFVADLPVAGHEKETSIVPAANAQDPRPWFFDKDTAKEAQQIAEINWKAESQLPTLMDEKGKAIPNNFRGIIKLTSVPFEADGLTFSLRCGLADAIPENFVHAGEKLAKAPGSAKIEWLIGPVEPLGNNRFRIALDRSWLGSGAACLAIRQPGNETIRDVVHPVYVEMNALRNTTGKPQKIAFAPLSDVPVGTAAVPLVATSDAGLPVSFFVVAGPAIVADGKLVFTPIPPRSKLPITVTVAAWQWGHREAPAVQMAEVVQQTLRLTAPAR